MKTFKESDFTDAELKEILDRAGVEGFKLWILGVLSCGIIPCIYFYLQDRRARKAKKEM